MHFFFMPRNALKPHTIEAQPFTIIEIFLWQILPPKLKKKIVSTGMLSICEFIINLRIKIVRSSLLSILIHWKRHLFMYISPDMRKMAFSWQKRPCEYLFLNMHLEIPRPLLLLLALELDENSLNFSINFYNIPVFNQTNPSPFDPT